VTAVATGWLTVDERRHLGSEAAQALPPSGHTYPGPANGRPDPVKLLDEQNATRDPDLVPVRHGRMSVSAFTFFRGAARIMAEDLSGAASSELFVQLCGDAHLSNFGVFASPERRLVFDVNDFDETLPGPFEYDVKRLASSFAVAARHNGFARSDRSAVVRGAVQAYHRAISEFAAMRTLDAWYAHKSEEDLRTAARAMAKGAKGAKGAKALERAERNLSKARGRDSLQALSKLAAVVGGEYRIVSRPPAIIRLEELAASQGRSQAEAEELVRLQLAAYLDSLSDDRRALLERFKVVDVARKVVGVGSVGTRSFIVLLQGRDGGDPLFLQAKEATRSVLEGHLPASRYPGPGERVVQGQRLMQSVSDIFLGWSDGTIGRDYYFRQLRDMKGSALVESMALRAMGFYADLCGWTLARAHARSGDAVAIDAYLGDGDEFEGAVTEFARRYAKQNQRDYEAFLAAIGEGRLETLTGV
jgi:uncharacterized protein (DUF2252 family)